MTYHLSSIQICTDLSCQLVSIAQRPATDMSSQFLTDPTSLPGALSARTRLTPEQWGQARAALAPPWSDRQWREALACLGIRINDQ